MFLNYERRGNGEPLLLLHGTGSHLQVWYPVMEPLANVYDVIAVDLPGHGKSPLLDTALPPTPSGFADVLANFLDHLGIATAHVAGNSVGGWTAFELAKRGHVRSVIAFSPAGLWLSHAPLYDVVSFRASRRLARTLGRMTPFVVSSSIGRTLLLSQMVAHPGKLSPASAADMVVTFAQTPGFDAHFTATNRECFQDGQTIDVPVTVAWGQHDRILLPHLARHREALPVQTRWIELPGCGHVPMYDDPDQVVQVVLNGTDTALGKLV